MNGETVRRWAVWAPAAVILLAVILDLATPTPVTTAPLLAVAPVLSAPLLSRPMIIVVGLVAMGVHALLAYLDGTFGWQRGISNQLTLVAVTLLAIALNRSLRYEHTTAQHARRAAATAVQAVLPTPPSRIGALRIAARYVPAESGALIGGDLYAVQDTPYGVRAMVGDVRGKGLSAISAVGIDVGAFRFAADQAPDLVGLVDMLEEALQREGQRRRGLEQSEGFTTALIAEFAADLSCVRLVNRGHPPPLLLTSRGDVTVLEPSDEAPPLGITSLGTWATTVDTFAFPPGATLLCHTDGITEARNPAGVFYRPESRIPHLLELRLKAARGAQPVDPGTVLDLLIRDVSRHSGGRAQDDQALLTLHRPLTTATRPTGGHSP
ncbi:PP2C family protein-serine/threonine phosphatase [Streptomyces sp. NPDC050161]|uniref:PP2C family protein-serine/threonine phosphatase n=1 Tax=Streptomyces sp. NPDC050161 TaxID=3365604 RepID=UPI00378F24B1